jgi:hypothetical protein
MIPEPGTKILIKRFGDNPMGFIDGVVLEVLTISKDKVKVKCGSFEISLDRNVFEQFEFEICK